ncbi:DUF771 domain-containing protein [Gracilibacillus sp. S3-1-1]|uniref:DUF771 domain-containing protein n=1 Tax=Gracilibacillus pellucidus TaxID=3095368 RepID=A0ACC6M9G6_9BACI|nr:DUF771 domain-containing protein [Gracilibacillus sp. S3-1-1]MDX8047595.1 DUF771 domain-containing protein [Gracilibacillus sp. S3-1-1]
MQQLDVNITIPIPSDKVLITKVELQELKENSLTGVYWNMKDLEKRVGKKQDWLKEHILYPPRFKKILDIQHGGFVYYPQSRGQTWTFQANKMAAFLDKHFIDIFK